MPVCFICWSKIFTLPCRSCTWLRAMVRSHARPQPLWSSCSRSPRASEHSLAASSLRCAYCLSRAPLSLATSVSSSLPCCASCLAPAACSCRRASSCRSAAACRAALCISLRSASASAAAALASSVRSCRARLSLSPRARSHESSDSSLLLSALSSASAVGWAPPLAVCARASAPSVAQILRLRAAASDFCSTSSSLARSSPLHGC
mmetsp:Transcript_23763/g.66748  ORF Transcript_23763/g.66748 Transcript_23763/m.66748 type:complete len:206 (+) Transcript_23763:261-878(+)